MLNDRIRGKSRIRSFFMKEFEVRKRKETEEYIEVH